MNVQFVKKLEHKTRIIDLHIAKGGGVGAGIVLPSHVQEKHVYPVSGVNQC